MEPTQSNERLHAGLKGLLPQLQATGGPRSLMVLAGAAFFALVAFMSIRHYPDNPWLFGTLTAVAVLAVIALLAIGLGVLGKPIPPELAPLSVMSIDKFGMFVASGVPSTAELKEVARAVLGAEPLPPPAGLVEGDPSDKKNWRDISEQESQKIASDDNSQVDRRLQQIALDIAEGMMKRALPWGDVGEPTKGKAIGTRVEQRGEQEK